MPMNVTRDELLAKLNEGVYLGDGVYASHDGFQFWLKTQSGMSIALEPQVVAKLKAYEQEVDTLIKLFKEQKPSEGFRTG